MLTHWANSAVPSGLKTGQFEFLSEKPFMVCGLVLMVKITLSAAIRQKA